VVYGVVVCRFGGGGGRGRSKAAGSSCAEQRRPRLTKGWPRLLPLRRPSLEPISGARHLGVCPQRCVLEGVMVAGDFDSALAMRLSWVPSSQTSALPAP
jgi:hypothetical protein